MKILSKHQWQDGEWNFVKVHFDDNYVYTKIRKDAPVEDAWYSAKLTLKYLKANNAEPSNSSTVEQYEKADKEPLEEWDTVPITYAVP